MLIPLFIQNELPASAANRISAFNFCDPFDHVLPLANSTISNLDRQHLWGLYIGILVGDEVPVIIEKIQFGKKFYGNKARLQNELIAAIAREDEEILVILNIIGKFLL